MPSGENIQRNMTGAWQLLLGRPDGLRLLDISADGFWNSFFAMVVAVPALAVGWVAMANDAAAREMGSRLSILGRLALIDGLTWVLPLVALALIARLAGIADRYVPYVVASN